MEALLLLLICVVVPVLIGILIVGFRMYKKLGERRDELEKELTSSQTLTKELKRENREKATIEWFEDVKFAQYRNEIEVETKFVYPLVKYLGYANENVNIRYPVEIQVGRSKNRGEADWVVWDDNPHNEGRKALFVIEAKGQDQKINTDVHEQARSYAFALNAPVYVCTNGRELAVFRRGVEEDICIVRCGVPKLSENWSEIRTVLRNKAI